MNARGFALIGVLWTVALLGTAVGLSLGAARVGTRAAALDRPSRHRLKRFAGSSRPAHIASPFELK